MQGLRRVCWAVSSIWVESRRSGIVSASTTPVKGAWRWVGRLMAREMVPSVGWIQTGLNFDFSSLGLVVPR